MRIQYSRRVEYAGKSKRMLSDRFRKDGVVDVDHISLKRSSGQFKRPNRGMNEWYRK
jgi:hypothetical protein